MHPTTLLLPLLLSSVLAAPAAVGQDNANGGALEVRDRAEMCADGPEACQSAEDGWDVTVGKPDADCDGSFSTTDEECNV